jgi:hypothetical protein
VEDVTFDVLKVMCERNMDIRLSTLDNMRQIKKIKGGTQVTIGIHGDVVLGLATGKFVGGLLLADAEQFRQIEKELKGL